MDDEPVRILGMHEKHSKENGNKNNVKSQQAWEGNISCGSFLLHIHDVCLSPRIYVIPPMVMNILL